MDTLQAIFTRRAIRHFRADTVDEALLRQLIDAAVHAPSAVNAQPWSFLVIRDKALLQSISHEIREFMLKTAPTELMAYHFRDILKNRDFDVLHCAPVLIVISTIAESPWTVEACSLAAENLMLAAHAAGLGTCWIGYAQAWLSTPEAKLMLDIPEAYIPVAPIVIGYADQEPTPIVRKEPEIHWI